MAHRFSVRDIARQAGVSDATVDRVLHGRPGVRATTAGQVRRAIGELQAQQSQLELSGRTFMIDVVADAPDRFSRALRRALEAELPLLRPAAFRARFHLRQQWGAAQTARQLEAIARRGSHGVLLKAADDPRITTAVATLAAAGIPVVTVVTDLPSAQRLAYVGMDNRAAGATAAYLMCSWLGSRGGPVAVTVSNEYFRGEEEREMGFRVAMRGLDPQRAIHELPASEGMDDAAEAFLRAALADHPDLAGLYSIGGGNPGLVRAVETAGMGALVLIGHDLNAENRLLLGRGALQAVLGHNLRRDVNAACRVIMHFHGALPGNWNPGASPIEIYTPYNMLPEAS